MRLIRTLFRPGRAFAALLLLASLVAGEAADARHHLSDQGCAAEHGGRASNCACATLHAVPVASEAPVCGTPVELEREFAPIAVAPAPRARAVVGAAPRAPPQG